MRNHSNRCEIGEIGATRKHAKIMKQFSWGSADVTTKHGHRSARYRRNSMADTRARLSRPCDSVRHEAAILEAAEVKHPKTEVKSSESQPASVDGTPNGSVARIRPVLVAGRRI